jgi:hypothetical protein
MRAKSAQAVRADGETDHDDQTHAKAGERGPNAVSGRSPWQ